MSAGTNLPEMTDRELDDHLVHFREKNEQEKDEFVDQLLNKIDGEVLRSIRGDR
jgi:hypothetical protein